MVVSMSASSAGQAQRNMKSLLLYLALVRHSLQYPHLIVVPDASPQSTSASWAHHISLTRRSSQPTGWSTWPSTSTSADSNTITNSASGTGTSQEPSTGSPSTSGSDVVPTGNIIDNARNAYLFPVTVEGQTFNVELDTGSSDTWFPRTGFQCYSSTDLETSTFEGLVDPEECDFAKTYTPGPGFVYLDAVYLWQCYGASNAGAARCVTGILGQADVQIGDLTASNQFIGAINQSSFSTRATEGESGILGLAFNGLTGGYYASNNETFPYSSIINTLLESGAVEDKQFSLALSRDVAQSGNGGVFTIGNLPDIHSPEVNVSTDWYSSKSFEYVDQKSSTKYSYYSIEIDSFFVDGNTYDPGLSVVIDSGFNIFQTPVATAKAMNDLWEPLPSGEVDNNGLLLIDCNAQYNGEIGINIAGRTFFADPADMVIEYPQGCVSLIKGVDGSNLNIIGDPFLKNVLAIFNWDKEILSFYPRRYYLS